MPNFEPDYETDMETDMEVSADCDDSCYPCKNCQCLEGNHTNLERCNIHDLYSSLNDSEQHGVKFGLFPERLADMTHEEVVEMMKEAKSF